MSLRVLIVEDDEDLCARYTDILTAAWSEVTVDRAHTEEFARLRLQNERYDLITLDMSLSESGDRRCGVRLLADMDKSQRGMVIVASAFIDESVQTLLSALRVFDILKKPYEDSEYLRAVRLGLESQGKIGSPGTMGAKFGDLEIDPLAGPPVWRGEKLTGCSLTQQRLLYKLASANGEPVPLRELGKALPASKPTDDNIRVHISELRKHFSNYTPTPIEVVTGVGYRWKP